MLETKPATIFSLSLSTHSRFSTKRAAATPPHILPSLHPSQSIGTDPKQTVAETNVPSTQTGFSVKESVAQSKFILSCVEGRTNGAWDRRRGGDRTEREERLLNLGGGGADLSVTLNV